MSSPEGNLFNQCIVEAPTSSIQQTELHEPNLRSPERGMYDECGIVAVVRPLYDAAEKACTGIVPLENRGKETAGVAINVAGKMIIVKDFGTGKKVFPDGGHSLNSTYPSPMALSQARYSTQGSETLDGAQPHSFEACVNGIWKELAHVHNGNLTNTEELAAILGINEYASDSELMGYAFMRTYEKLTKAANGRIVRLKDVVAQTLPLFKGAFTGALMSDEEIVVFTDHHGLKPAAIGLFPDGGCMIASEITALEEVGATHIRDMGPAEMVTMHNDGAFSSELWAVPEPKFCLLELLYFIKAKTKKGTLAKFGGLVVEEARKTAAYGAALANPLPDDVDFVFGIPNSGKVSGEGLAQASGKPYNPDALTSNKEDRSFIDNVQSTRDNTVNDKLEAHKEHLHGKNVGASDDSFIRGTTGKKVNRKLREAGAKKTHFRSATPKLYWPCELGIDLGNPDELLAAKSAQKLGIDISGGLGTFDEAPINEEMRRYLQVNSLGFLTLELLDELVLGDQADKFCKGCITGTYPEATPTPVQIRRRAVQEEVNEFVAASKQLVEVS